jgi:hypothetical protein
MLVPSLAPRFSEGTNSQTEMIAVVLTASEETVATPMLQMDNKIMGNYWDNPTRCGAAESELS